MSVFFRLYQHLLPRAKAWSIVADTTLRKFFLALAATPESFKTFVDGVWLEMFPDETNHLAEWENQFAIFVAAADTEQERRTKLDGAWKASGGQSPSYLQSVLQNAGFDLYVHDSWSVAGPPAWTIRDPRDYTDQPDIGSVQCWDDPDQPQCSSGFDTGTGDPITQWQCDDLLQNDPRYLVNSNLTRRAPPPVPDDSDTWPHFVYFGPETLSTTELVYIPETRRAELERLILKHTPAQDWKVLMTVYHQLQELGTMVGMWRADYPDNVITGGKFERYINIADPGTHDWYQSSAATRTTYEATGWAGTKKSGYFDLYMVYNPDTLAPLFDGKVPITIVVAIEWVTPFTGEAIIKFAKPATANYHILTTQAGDWTTRRWVPPAAQVFVTDFTPSGREIYISSFDGTTCTTWRNGVKQSDAVSMNLGNATFIECTIGGFTNAEARFGLMALYSTAFTDAQAAMAYALVLQDYPVS